MNIYIGNLNYNVDSDDLREIFEEYGSVDSAKVITDKFTGKSKGFGFVEMGDESEANNAISELNEAELEGRTMRVNVARERAEKSRSFNR